MKTYQINQQPVGGQNIDMGSWGERRAERYLKELGLQIVESNFRCKAGEIDIIAVENDKTVLFIEVKTRRDLSRGLPCEAVNKNKQRRISRAAALYIAIDSFRNKIPKFSEYRFDVIEILILNNRVWIRHIKDAFRLDE
jgi:putative endonuclease